MQFVKPPFEITETGQVAMVGKLNNTTKYTFGPGNKAQQRRPFVVPLDSKKNEKGLSWSVASLGGKARVNALKRFFRDLYDMDARLVVCTKGYVDTVRKIMQDVDIERYFARFYGRSDVEYQRGAVDPTGEPDDDRKRTNWTSKGQVLKELVREYNLAKEEAVLIDDDIRELTYNFYFHKHLLVST